MIKEVDKRPTEGQFVVTWVYKDMLWSEVIRYYEFGISRYCFKTDSFEKSNLDFLRKGKEDCYQGLP